MMAKRMGTGLRSWLAVLAVVIGILFAASAPSESNASQPAMSGEIWRTNTNAFVDLTIRQHLSIGITTIGIRKDLPISETVLKQIIGQRVTWSLRRDINPIVFLPGWGTNPFSNLPATLSTAPVVWAHIQEIGSLVVVPRGGDDASGVFARAYDTVPYQQRVTLSGVISSVRATTIGDGHVYLIVELADVLAPTDVSIQMVRNLEGIWKVSSDHFPAPGLRPGTLTLRRAAEFDSGDFEAYAGSIRTDNARSESTSGNLVVLYAHGNGDITYCDAPPGAQADPAVCGERLRCELHSADPMRLSGNCTLPLERDARPTGSPIAFTRIVRAPR